MFSEPGRRVAAGFALGGSLALAVLLRAEYLRELIGTPFWGALLLDAEWYDQAARELLRGASPNAGEAYFRPPLYPWFLAMTYRIFGFGLLAPRLLQTLLGLVLVAVTWRVALRSHGERAAAVTALLAATYGMFIYFESELLGATLATLLTAAGTMFLLEGDRRDSVLRFAAAGAVLGLAAITHATALVLAPVAVVWAGVRPGRRLVPALGVLVGFALPVGGVTARNVAVSGDFVLVCAQGGINFYVGNGPEADGKSALAPGVAEPDHVLVQERYRDNVALAAEALAERDMGTELSAAAVDRYWFGRTLGWMADHPKSAAALLVRKVIFFWNGFEIANNRDFGDQAERFTPILRFFLVQYAFLLPFAIFGVFYAGGPGRARALLISFLLAWTLGVSLFFVCTRFRLPAVPWLLPFGAAGFLAFVDVLRRARSAPGRLGRASAVLVGAFALTNGLLVTRSGIADVTAHRDAPFHRYNLAVVYERAGDLDRAIAEYQAVADTGVPDPRVHLNLGNLLVRTGRSEEARDEYRRVLRIAPDYTAAVRTNLGILATQERDWTEAVRHFEEALRADPGTDAAMVGLAAAYLSAGRFDEAVVAHRRAIAAEAGPEPALRKSLAVAYLEIGLLEDAEKEAQTVLRLSPDDVVAILTLGKVYTLQGQEAAAERMWAKAREIAPNVAAVDRAIADALTVKE